MQLPGSCSSFTWWRTMSRELIDLEDEFREQVVDLLLSVRNDGFELRPFFTLRDPFEQARLWRQSRTTAEIREAEQWLNNNNARWLSTALIHVGPQSGQWATNALPGLSWHQWGTAVDCFVLEDNKAVWKSTHPGYVAYAERAHSMGLVAGHFWRKRDSVHVQQNQLNSPLKLYGMDMINNVMKGRFDGS